MPTGVKMYVRLKEPPSAEELHSLRSDLLRAMDLTEKDFHNSGPLLLVPKEDRSYMPVKDESSVWLDANLWKPYYGPGYERGDPELFVKLAEWFEQRLPGSEIYYGHDVSDENVFLFDGPARKKLMDLSRVL